MTDPTASAVEASTPSSSTSPLEEIHIHVKQLNGDTIALTVPSTLTISSLRAQLSSHPSISSSSSSKSDIRLAFVGKHLNRSSRTLADYHILSGSTLHLVATSSASTTTTTTINPGSSSSTTNGGNKRQRCTFKDCRDVAQRIVGDCGFCHGRFCGRHRLLEDHRCVGLEDCKKSSHDANADKLIAERTAVVKGV